MDHFISLENYDRHCIEGAIPTHGYFFEHDIFRGAINTVQFELKQLPMIWGENTYCSVLLSRGLNHIILKFIMILKKNERTHSEVNQVIFKIREQIKEMEVSMKKFITLMVVL